MRRVPFMPVFLVAASLSAESRFEIPVARKVLPNGLVVVVSEDHSAPTFGLCLGYRIGFRLETKGRTGFAHLFEHMMFEGSPKAPKGVIDRVIEGGGGVNNAQTQSDYTDYIETAPVSALEPVLWLEADRMKGLDFSKKTLDNQRDVVKEEIRVNVKNRPYGDFFNTGLASKAFDKWENSHDGYGSFDDLDAASLGDVESFFKAYYGPNNAVLVLVGDFSPEEAFRKVEKYFSDVPSRPAPPPPDVFEPSNTAPRKFEEKDALANAPGLAVGWKMPPMGKGESVAGAVLAQLLLAGDASRLYQGLVKGKEILLSVDGGMNWGFGTPWDYSGPTLFTVFAVYKPATNADAVLQALDEEIGKIAHEGVPAEELARTKTKMVSDLYSSLELPLNRATALVGAELFSSGAASLNSLGARIRAVSSSDLARIASMYLVDANRTAIDRRPEKKQEPR